MTYRVDILPSAQKQLAKVDRNDRSRIISAIRALATDCRPHGCKEFSGRPAWRIRVGVYRVIYEIHDDHLLVVAIGHRKNIYR